MRKPAKSKGPPGSQISTVHRQAAPIKGWVSNENIVGMDQQSAYLLDNWFPETNSIKLRPGYDIHNTIPGGGAVTTIMIYQAGGATAVFAASGSYIYDVTASSPFLTPFSQGNWPNPRGPLLKPSLYNLRQARPLPT